MKTKEVTDRPVISRAAANHVQGRLTVGRPGDRYEQEADRVADQVMTTQDPVIRKQPLEEEEEAVQAKAVDPGAGIQLQVEEEEEEMLNTSPETGRIPDVNTVMEKKRNQFVPEPFIQKNCGCEDQDCVRTKPLDKDSRPWIKGIQKSNGNSLAESGNTGSPISKAQLHAGMCGGSPLPASSRKFFENRFGTDFSRVKIHTCDTAVDVSRSLNAKAFTYGSNIFFNQGQFKPGTFSGDHLLAHELTHVVQQGGTSGPRINMACLSSSSCPSSIPGSATSFGAGETAREAGPRARRKRMSCSRALSTSHGGRARQLEILLQNENPALRAQIHGIFIDVDMSSGTGAMVTDCGGWVNDGLPAGCTPPGMAGASKPCVLVHGELNRQAFRYNHSRDDKIGGTSREDWKITTLQTLVHEAQHVVFDTSSRPAPPGTTGCPRSRVSHELTELNAIMSEFPIVYRPAASARGSARTHAINRLNNWYRSSITNPYESFAGTLRAMRCECNCTPVNAYVRDVFNLVSSSWSPGEKTAFNREMRKPRWNAAPHRLNWPL